MDRIASPVRVSCVWLLAAVLALASLTGPRVVSHEARPVVITVDATTTCLQLLDRIDQQFGELHLFVWGDVVPAPGAVQGEIAWREGRAEGRIEGWFMPVDELGRLVGDSRINSFMVVTYDGDTLWGSHPSDDYRWPIVIPDEPSDERLGVLALVVPIPNPENANDRVLPLLRAVRWLPRIAQVSVL